MKKSFLYLSSIAFASLLIIDSADAWGKKSKEPKETIASSIFNGADTGTMVKSLASEISTLKKYETSLGALEKAVVTFVSDSKSFSHDHEPALPIIMAAPLTGITIYAKALIKANTDIEKAMNNYIKMKAKSSKQEAEGRKLVELGSSLSDVGPVALATFRTGVVIADKALLGKQGTDVTRIGDFETKLKNTLKLFGEKKKIFSKKLVAGELGAEQALDEVSKGMADSLDGSKLHPVFEKYSKNIQEWDELINLNKEYIEALIAFIGGDTEQLRSLAEKCNEQISGANGSANRQRASHSRQTSDDYDEE